MRNWIYALITLLPSYLAKPARWIADRIFSVFTDSIRFAVWIKGAAYKLMKGIQRLAWGLKSFVREVYTTLKWVIEKWVPDHIAHIKSTLIRYVNRLIEAFDSSLRWLIARTSDLLWRAVNWVTAFARDMYQWASDKISSITSLVSKLIERVFVLWATPERLATWIIGALWRVAWRYIYQRRNAIIAYLLRNSTALTVWLARELESILVRLL